MLARGEREINQLLLKFVCCRFAFGFSGPPLFYFFSFCAGGVRVAWTALAYVRMVGLVPAWCAWSEWCAWWAWSKSHRPELPITRVVRAVDA